MIEGPGARSRHRDVGALGNIATGGDCGVGAAAKEAASVLGPGAQAVVVVSSNLAQKLAPFQLGAQRIILNGGGTKLGAAAGFGSPCVNWMAVAAIATSTNAIAAARAAIAAVMRGVISETS